MKNTFGNSVSVTLFGESHGEEIGAVIDGLTPGIRIDTDYIDARLTLRRPSGSISTARQEADQYRIVSGVFNGYTTGTPVTILIPNTNTKSRDYSATRFLARPGHADYTANVKYHGCEDYRGGGHFSGRITAAVVAAGAITDLALKTKDIQIGTHIKRLGGISDRGFENMNEDIRALNSRAFAVLDQTKEAPMTDAILAAREAGDSIGGLLETACLNVPAGVGEPWFDSLESMLSHALFGIPAVKGVLFGDALDLIDARGSVYNDSFRMKDGKVVTDTNHNGGINGGITNGMPVVFTTLVKPTPSIYQDQDTIDFEKMTDAVLAIHGRHDPAVIHRARVVADSIASIVLCDALAYRFGTDYFGED